jgi:hypothetical protein
MVMFRGASLPVTAAGLANARQKLAVEDAEVWAVVFTETDPPNRAGFWSNRRPQILYEQHIFHRLTNGAFDDSNSDISNRNPGNYGPSGDHQYDRLLEAVMCDRDAAIQSTSWGMGQTLGENFREAGFTTVEGFMSAMLQSEDAHLLAMANEIVATNCATPLREHRWSDFARIYNGPNFVKNHYDITLARWFEFFTQAATPNLQVRSAQMFLLYLGFDPRGIDGMFGDHTRSAMQQYQGGRGLPLTEALDDATFESLLSDFKNLPT